MADKILDRLHAVHPEGLTRVQVRDLFSNHTSAARIDTAIEGLEGAGLVREESERTGGRPRIVIRLSIPTGAESVRSAERDSGENGGRLPAPNALSAQGDTGQVLALLTDKLGAEVVCELPPGAPPTAGVCDMCTLVSAQLESLTFDDLSLRLCEDCAAELRPEFEAWTDWNALVAEGAAS